jgi:hypothetical protein
MVAGEMWQMARFRLAFTIDECALGTLCLRQLNRWNIFAVDDSPQDLCRIASAKWPLQGENLVKDHTEGEHVASCMRHSVSPRACSGLM